MARRKEQDQLALFAFEPEPEPEKKGVGAAVQSEEVEALGRELPRGIYLGGSTWSFPGWAGLVYDRAYSPSKLAHEGLPAYARHPLLRAVGVDRTHYAPVEAVELARYREAVPEDFRFLVKAHEACTLARFPDHARYGAQRGQENPLFLDPVYATDQVVAPFAEGTGIGGGALLFQFAPQSLGSAGAFAQRLHDFLAALPLGPVYAVELRNRELITAEYGDALAAVGACHCHNVHPRMPDVRAQARLAGTDRGADDGRPLAPGTGDDLRGGGPPLRPLQPHGRAGPRQPPGGGRPRPRGPGRRTGPSSVRSTTTPRGARRCRRWSWRGRS